MEVVRSGSTHPESKVARAIEPNWLRAQIDRTAQVGFVIGMKMISAVKLRAAFYDSSGYRLHPVTLT